MLPQERGHWVHFMKLVEDMRKLQNLYWSAPRKSDSKLHYLKEAKKFETLVDNSIRNFKNTQVGLFDNSKSEGSS